MKKFFYILFILLFSFLYQNSAHSLSDYQIKKKCRNSKNSSICIKNLKDKKNNLINGNRIEIPVVPFKN